MSILASTKLLLSDNWPVPELLKSEPGPIFDDEHFFRFRTEARDG